MIGEKIRKLRKERGLTQKQLEALTGVAQRNISSYEAGKLKPSGRTLSRFAAAFGVSVNDFTGETPREPSLALDDHELLEMFREVEKLPETDKTRLKWVISLALKQNRLHQMMAS